MVTMGTHSDRPTGGFGRRPSNAMSEAHSVRQYAATINSEHN